MPASANQHIPAKIVVATVLMWSCLAASVGPFLYAIYRFWVAVAADHADGGSEGFAIILLLFSQGILLLFPLIGFMFALRWRRSLQDRLAILETDS